MELHPPHRPGVPVQKNVLAEPTWDFASNKATGMKLSLICLNSSNFLYWATIATQEPPLGHMINVGCLLEMSVREQTLLEMVVIY